MGIILDAAPVVFMDPFTDAIATMPVEMISAYAPFPAEHLHLEEAAIVAAVRDTDEATNLLLSIEEAGQVLSIS